MSITFFVSGIPKPQPRPRAFARQVAPGKWMARAYDAGTAEGWKSQIADASKRFIPASPLDGPLSLRVTFNLPRPKSHYKKDGSLRPDSPKWHISKPDADNLIKAVKDCMTLLGFWRDDSQICEELVLKLYCPRLLPGASIEVMQLEAAESIEVIQLEDAEIPNSQSLFDSVRIGRGVATALQDEK